MVRVCASYEQDGKFLEASSDLISALQHAFRSESRALPPPITSSFLREMVWLVPSHQKS